MTAAAASGPDAGGGGAAGPHVVTLSTASLGDRTYVVHDGTVALVVDPQRDLDRLERVLADAGVTLGAVFETHVHNDYVSGGLELARRHAVAYHVAADEVVAHERVPVADGDVVTVGSVHVRALHTPGHTPTHLSYVVGPADGAATAVLTGGSLLFGSVGRTDLVAPERTEELTRLQHRSARLLARELADDVAVLPTHGFGSFCSSGETAGSEASTIGQERRENQALRTTDEAAFVADLLAGLDAYPAYYAHMAPTNRGGPAPVDLTAPAPLGPGDVTRQLARGAWVVDLRGRRAYAAGHHGGTINIGLEDSMSTHLGWLLPWGTPVVLVGEQQQVAAARRQLVRIGIDDVVGAIAPDELLDGTATSSYPVAGFADLRVALDSEPATTVLDTRRALEWADGRLAVAHHLPLHDLPARLDEVPPGRVWVHCAGGYRASVGASLLARAGRDVVLVDEDLTHAGDHLEVVR